MPFALLAVASLDIEERMRVCRPGEDDVALWHYRVGDDRVESLWLEGLDGNVRSNACVHFENAVGHQWAYDIVIALAGPCRAVDVAQAHGLGQVGSLLGNEHSKAVERQLFIAQFHDRTWRVGLGVSLSRFLSMAEDELYCGSGY